MLKRISIFVLLLTLTGTLAATTLAQDDDSDAPTFDDALTIIREAYPDAEIIGFERDDDCYEFRLDDGSELCVSRDDSTLSPDDDDNGTPEATITPDDDDDDDDDDSTPEATVTPDDDDDRDDDSTPEANVTPDDDDNDDGDDDTQAMITNNTTVEQAIAEAQRIFPGVDVVSIELEDEDGVLYWRVRLDGGREVLVEDADGNALDFGPTGSTSVDGISFRDRDDDDDDDDNGDDDRDDRDDRDDDDDGDDDRDDRRDDDDDDDNNNDDSDDDDDD